MPVCPIGNILEFSAKYRFVKGKSSFGISIEMNIWAEDCHSCKSLFYFKVYRTNLLALFEFGNMRKRQTEGLFATYCFIIFSL